MKILLVCIWIMWGSIGLFGQTAEESTIRLKQEESPVIQSSRSPDDEQFVEGHQVNKLSLSSDPASLVPDREKGHLGITVGTSFSYMRGYGSGMMLYAAPTYTLPLNNRWALHGGLIASGYQGFYPPGSGELYVPAQYTSLAVFAAASYRMNDRLILHGAGVKQLISGPVTPFTPYTADYLSVGATYKLGDNISIGATIHINNGGGYYSDPFHYSDPFNRYGFQPPYFW
ncbi:MAG: hypothetical protein ACWGNV_12000 [Bacteroidales bacterium]